MWAWLLLALPPLMPRYLSVSLQVQSVWTSTTGVTPSPAQTFWVGEVTLFRSTLPAKTMIIGSRRWFQL